MGGGPGVGGAGVMRVVLIVGVLVVALGVALLLVEDDDVWEEQAGEGTASEGTASEGAETPVEPAQTTAAAAGTWVEVDCPVDPGPTDIAVTCGELSVPVRRDVADGPAMALAVAVLHRRADPGLDDAVLYLVGGPGGSALAELEAWTTDPLLDTRDVVLLDQRGTGWSTPSLQCPESHDALDGDEQLEAFERCRSRLLASGVDLDAYRTASIAADVADLRVALGYDSWNLWGSSYGTRVALAVLRDHPEGVRSAILEGAYPMDVDAYTDTVAAATSALDGLFALCAADADCAGAYPNLPEVFASTVVRLDADPVVLDDDEQSELDGIAFAEAVVGGLGQSAVVPVLPAWITAIAGGGDEPLHGLVERTGYGHEQLDDSEPVFYLVECAEEVAHSTLAGLTPDAIAATLEVAADDLVVTGPAEMVAATIAACAVWDTTPADPIEDAPVTSDVPALVLAGGLDPATPPWWGAHLASTLGSATLLELPTLGHDTVDADWCPRELVESFIDDPNGPLDTSCITSMEIDFLIE